MVVVLTACGDDGSGPIEVFNAEFRTTPNDLGAGYLTIANGTEESITLVGASSPDVTRIELHESTLNDEGVMQMRARPEGFIVGAGEQVSLQPGGKHLMLIEPDPPGDELVLTLDFGSEQLVVTASFDEAASATSDSMADMEDDG